MTRDLNQYRDLMTRMANKKEQKKLKTKTTRKDSCVDNRGDDHATIIDIEHDHDGVDNNECMSMENFNVLIVTHGLCLRLIIMRYFQLSVEEFEESYNAENAKLYIMNRKIQIIENYDTDAGAIDYSQYYGGGLDSSYEEREFFKLDDESRDALNLKGDISNEKPVFRRDGYDI